jgi:hypothetical protein
MCRYTFIHNILNLEARKGDWLASRSGRLIFWEITIGELRSIGEPLSRSECGGEKENIC